MMFLVHRHSAGELISAGLLLGKPDEMLEVTKPLRKPSPHHITLAI